MTGNKVPLVSILSSSFNHEKHVSFFIESVLAQTNPNWELIIVDDGSIDNNVAEIKKYTDTRIKFMQQPFNMGMNCALNIALKNASGKYIVFFGSDDMMMPNFVDCIQRVIKHHPGIGVIYPNLQCIDANNKIIKNKIEPYNATRFGILRELFYNGNVMTSPGMVIKKDAFEQIMPLDVAMSQHHDYQIHVKLLLNNDCYVLSDKLVLYRVPTRKSGMSFSTLQSRCRCNAEEKFVMDAFLTIQDTDVLNNIFGNDLKQFGTIDTKMIPYVLGCLAIQKSKNYFKKIWGYNIVAEFMNVPGHYNLLNKLYGFKYSDFLNLANYFDASIYEKKYLKYKKLFNITLMWVVIILIVLIAGYVI